MAKRRYDLDETMEDVSINIEEAKNRPVIEEPILIEPVVAEPEEVKAEIAQPVIEEKKEDVPPLPIVETEKRKKKVKKTPIIETDSDEKSNIRNVELDDETLWRLDAVKNKLNRARSSNDSMITQKSIIKTALLEWLDKRYPETKEAYQIINNM